MSAPPPISLPAKVRSRLDEYSPCLADELEGKICALRRPCVYFDSHRVSPDPLRRSALTRFFGKQEADPILPATASKFGGIPYCEAGEEWGDWSFVGQFDLADATALLPDVALTGLLRIDTRPQEEREFRVRWFPSPTQSAFRARTPIACVAKWETRIEFHRGWSLPHNDRDWFSLLPEPLHDDLWDFWNDFPCVFNYDAGDRRHTILGWRSGGLDEHYGFTPPPGCTEDIAEYEMLVRVTFDNAAGFHWGCNCVYCLVPKSDLAKADLSRVVMTGANS